MSAVELQQWKATLTSQLAVRDALQATYFKDLVAGYDSAVAAQREALLRCRKLQLEASEAQRSADALLIERTELQQRVQAMERERRNENVRGPESDCRG
eukprot:SAG31_NODE_13902_length_838_cov_1.615697_1_plen_98_part_01